MARAKRGFKRRRRGKKLYDRAEGFVMRRKSTFRRMAEAVDRALSYEYRDRRAKKRNFRALWITRISAASVMNSMSYSQFINSLKKSSVQLDRKVLADIAVHDPAGFAAICDEVRA
ncbi:MAG: 50S ribosomal protein L20 [Bdellovibrionaceae bacterium]|nr:50S ribosomal protein L20 [Pseudobdellovibrionaceae bacterium]